MKEIIRKFYDSLVLERSFLENKYFFASDMYTMFNTSPIDIIVGGNLIVYDLEESKRVVKGQVGITDLECYKVAVETIVACDGNEHLYRKIENIRRIAVGYLVVDRLLNCFNRTKVVNAMPSYELFGSFASRFKLPDDVFASLILSSIRFAAIDAQDSIFKEVSAKFIVDMLSRDGLIKDSTNISELAAVLQNYGLKPEMLNVASKAPIKDDGVKKPVVQTQIQPSLRMVTASAKTEPVTQVIKPKVKTTKDLSYLAKEDKEILSLTNAILKGYIISKKALSDAVYVANVSAEEAAAYVANLSREDQLNLDRHLLSELLRDVYSYIEILDESFDSELMVELKQILDKMNVIVSKKNEEEIISEIYAIDMDALTSKISSFDKSFSLSARDLLDKLNSGEIGRDRQTPYRNIFMSDKGDAVVYYTRIDGKIFVIDVVKFSSKGFKILNQKMTPEVILLLNNLRTLSSDELEKYRYEFSPYVESVLERNDEEVDEEFVEITEDYTQPEEVTNHSKQRNDINAISVYIKYLLEIGEATQAAFCATNYIVNYGKNEVIHSQLITALTLEGRIDLALKSCEKAEKWYPNNRYISEQHKKLKAKKEIMRSRK